jgi:Spy/CpxP family protein refolding chaperone
MNIRSPRFAAFAAAALLACSAPAVFAQPGSAGPGHGPHGGGPGFGIESILAPVKAQLGLNTSQQVMWDNAVAQTKAAREAGRGAMESVRASLNAELAKAEPDFAAVGAVGDAAQASQQAQRKVVRDEWLKLYATFSPAQKAIVRDAAKARMAKMETFRERMQERRARPQ